MKKHLILSASMITLLLVSISCSDDFLEVDPPGAYSEPSLQNATGVEGMLIGTYSALDGSYFESWGSNNFNQHGGASNWVMGSVRSEDAYKGTEPNDGVDINALERAETQPNNPHINQKWRGCYDGIGQANTTIRNARLLTDAHYG